MEQETLFTSNRKSFAFNPMLTFLHTVYSKNRMEASGNSRRIEEIEIVLKFLRVVAQFCGVSGGEALFCLAFSNFQS